MLHVDSHYLIGSSHSVCEDYAIHSDFKFDTNPDFKPVTGVIGMIADGCSQSDNSDVGARSMAWFVNKSFYSYLYSFEGYRRIFIKGEGLSFHNNLIDHIRGIPWNLSSKTFLPYGEMCLDSTVWLISASDKNLAVFGWGDGAFVVKRKSGTTIYCVSYESGAPFYLSYYLYKSREESYLATFQNTYTLSCLKINSEGNKSLTHKEVPYNTPFFINVFDQEDDPIISASICSDGFKTYTNSEDNFLGSLEWSVTRMIDYPTVEGVFVERSMRFLEKMDQKKQLHHLDDISMASIAFVQESKNG